MMNQECPKLKYKRILLKFSGEALMGKSQFGIDPSVLSTGGPEALTKGSGLPERCCSPLKPCMLK